MSARRSPLKLALVLVLAIALGLPAPPISVAGVDDGDRTPSFEIQGWDLPRVPVELIRRALKRVLEFLEDVIDQWVPGDPPWPPADSSG
ncbi:MAG: hypothetical protein ACREOU_02530 [Candidatus Eiseniibacteriota bacterium]